MTITISNTISTSCNTTVLLIVMDIDYRDNQQLILLHSWQCYYKCNRSSLYLLIIKQIRDSCQHLAQIYQYHWTSTTTNTHCDWLRTSFFIRHLPEVPQWFRTLLISGPTATILHYAYEDTAQQCSYEHYIQSLVTWGVYFQIIKFRRWNCRGTNLPGRNLTRHAWNRDCAIVIMFE